VASQGSPESKGNGQHPFPCTAVISNIAPGDYTTLITLDRAPFNPSAAGPENVTMSIDIRVPTGASWVEVTFVDSYADLEVEEVDYTPSNDLYVSTANPYGPGELGVTTSAVPMGTHGAPVDMLIMTPESADGEFPIVVFQHGFLMAGANDSEVLEQVASHGFVIVAPQMYAAPFSRIATLHQPHYLANRTSGLNRSSATP
jgi:hypothetical protein